MNAAQTVTANFDLFSYFSFELTVSKSGSGNGTFSSSDGIINCDPTCWSFSTGFSGGAIVNLIATADSNSVFTGWSGGGCSGTGSCTVTMNAAQTVTANFAPTSYSLSINKSGNGLIYSDDYKINCGSTCSANFNGGIIVNLNATPDAGYMFSNWSNGCTGSGACSILMNSAKAVLATFNPAPTYAIGLVANPSAGGSVTCSVNPVIQGGSTNCTATPNTGYTFTGFGGDCYGTSCSLTNVTANKTVTANFTAKKFTVSTLAKPSIGGSVSCSVNPVSYGGSSNCTATANAGYTFTGFAGDCSGTSCSLTNVTSNKNVTANFTAKKFTVSILANPSIGGGVSCSVNPVAYGGSSNCTATANTDYTFAGFSGDCSGKSCSLTNVTANKTVTANFTAKKFTVSTLAKPSIGGSVSCSVNPVSYGGSSNCSATPNSGYTFTGFAGDCSGTYCSLNNVTSNKTVTANFTAITYPINATANPSIGGSVNCSVNPVSYGGSSNCTATANAGYTFTGFGGDCSSTYCNLNNVTGNKTVTANFTAITYPINATANPSIGGSVSCSVNPVTYGGSSNCTATPNSGYTFTGFGGDCYGASCSLTNVTANKIVTANFKLTAGYVLNVIKKGTGSGVVTTTDGKINCGMDCNESHTNGQSVTLKAIADVGSVFTGWSGACNGSSTCTISMNATQNVTATFTATAVDLAITNMVITPTTPIINGLFDVAVTVKNFSKKALDAGSLTIWKSQTKIGTCGALGNAQTKVGSLAAGASRTLTARLRTPNAGTYTARAFIDSRCTTTESNEADNQLTKSYTVK
ncbi:hypothetical protein CKO12_04270 [Chromatium okenii]|nr:hypothetical protein [Chromatium okenii]